MSTMNPLPPQAYTKDILVQAYAWLQNQSGSIKELATTPDVLVSLYLKAKLQGDGALERPSIQNFKNELKNLAGMIGEFEVLEPQNSQQPSGASAAPSQTIRIRSQDARPSEPLISHTIPNQSGLDSRSRDMIQEVKMQFNLSSDSEAQRLLLAIGYNQIRSLLK
jgi:hypothetical protein